MTDSPAPLTPEQQQAFARMEDIRDIAPPVPYAGDLHWGWWVGAALLLAGLAALLAWGWRRRRRPDADAGPVPVPAHDRALRDLGELGGQGELTDKTFYFRLSEITRTYLDGRFALDTREKTSEELGPVLAALPGGTEHERVLCRLLQGADPIKYADAAATPERRAQDLRDAVDFVRATASAPEG